TANVTVFATQGAQVTNLVSVIGGSSLPATVTDIAPALPATPFLAGPDGPMGVPVNQVSLFWSSIGADSYDLYFGSTSPPPLLANDLLTTVYSLNGLNTCTTYYWQVVARNAAGRTPSRLATFTTTASVSLNPANATFPA